MLLDKHDLSASWAIWANETQAMAEMFTKAPIERILNILREIARTQEDLCARAQAGPRYDERWEDLRRCLALDGYQVRDRDLIATEPTIGGAVVLEDDLTVELGGQEWRKKPMSEDG